jgi:uncharacterized pyridoxal phosphate-dependent enzyme
VVGYEETDELYRRLGVKTLINGYTTLTRLGGSLMEPEVLEAMRVASRRFIDLDELLAQSGRHLARLMGAEAALITGGASAAVTLSAAACMTGIDIEKIRRLPLTEGLRNEVIVQRSHSDPKRAGVAGGYLKAIEVSGARRVEVETRAELEAAIHSRTAMIHFANYCEPFSTVHRAEWLAVSKERGIPALLDAAEAIPPRGRIRELLEMGFDLIVLSGGKGFRGPQCSGLLLGSRDLIEAARLNMCPHVEAVGRGFKVGKEEIVGLVVAIERFYERDEERELLILRGRLDFIREALQGLPGIGTEIFVPPERNVYPHLRVFWDEVALGFTWAEIADRLWNGDPPIAVRTNGPGADRVEGLEIASFTLLPEEVLVVAERLQRALKEAFAAC